MTREKLNRYKKNKLDIALLDKSIEKLENRLEELPVVSGKVMKSGDDFPYIMEHLSVPMAEPKESAKINDRIRAKESRRNILLGEIEEVEDFIDGMPEGTDKEIFEMLYLDGMTQQEVGESVCLERSAISKRVDRYLKLSHNSHF